MQSATKMIQWGAKFCVGCLHLHIAMISWDVERKYVKFYDPTYGGNKGGNRTIRVEVEVIQCNMDWLQYIVIIN